MITRSVLFERFAGRDKELHHLVDLRERSARELRGGGVSIAGDAGVGKSRLLSEFAQASRHGHGFVRVRCEELPVAYAPFVNALAQLRALGELKRSDHVLRLLDAAHDVLTTSDGTSDAAGRRRTHFVALVAAFGEAAKRLGQLTLAIDDVHWSDLSSLDALLALVRAIPSLPMVVAIAYRPEDLHTNYSRATTIAAIERENLDRIRLGPLPFGEIAGLLRQCLPGIGHPELQRIYDLSEGLPYVAEELARNVAEHGQGADVATTLTLRSAVLERAAQLTPADREIIERAAVLGRNFAPDDLAALGISQSRLFGALQAGLDLQLLEQREVDGVPWFRFRHALTREILYRNLMGIERRALHLEIADHLAADDARIAELAYHVSAAGEAQRAVIANERAGDTAMNILASSDAARLFARALDFTTDPETLARVSIKLATCQRLSGDPDDMLASTERNVERLIRAQRPDDAIILLHLAAEVLFESRFGVALQLLERANKMLQPDTSPLRRLSVELLNVRLFSIAGRLREAREAYARAEALVDRSMPSYNTSIVYREFMLAYYGHDVAKAQAVFDRRVTELPKAEAGDLEAYLAYLRGDVRRSVERAMASAASWQEAGFHRGAVFNRCYAAWFAAQLGDFDFVHRVIESNRLEVFEETYYLQRARALMLRATDLHCAAALEAMFELALEHGSPQFVYAVARDLAFVLESDRKQSLAVLTRAWERYPFGLIETGFVEAMIEFGSDDDVARAMQWVSETPAGEGAKLFESGLALIRARLARREHRSLEATQLARAALAIELDANRWLQISHAQELGGDLTGARTTLERAGACAELFRLNQRHGKTDAAPRIVLPNLTRREDQIARSIAAGSSTREVGEKLSIAPRTVETHLANVYLKLGINSRAELAEYFA